MDSTVGREATRTDMEGLLLWSGKGVFSWVVDEGILLDFSLPPVWCGGEVRLVERELLLLLAAAAAESVDVGCGGVLELVFESELELEVNGSGVKSSESLSQVLLWVMWIVSCSCRRAESAAALRAWSSV
jgi:hypothetical protein